MQLTSQTATASGGAQNGLMNLTYGYQASAGQMGAGSTAGNAGQLVTISGTIGGLTESATYSYDNLGRLVTSNQTSNGATAQRRFAYDRWGNRTGMWDVVSGGTQIQSITLQQSGGAPTNQIASVTAGSTVNYSYDAAGNVTNDGPHTYSYDAENRIVSVDGGATASYAYDQSNRRYKKVVGATVTHYVWDGAQAIAKYDGSTGAVNSEYVFSGSRMIAKVSSGVTQYFLSDRLSARLMLDTSGNVIGRQGHLPFGEDFGESGSQEKHHFTSYERDSEAGTDYAVNRQYSQNIGRFNSADPYRPTGYLIDAQSWNRYRYSRNDSINLIDPLGLFEGPPSNTNPIDNESIADFKRISEGIAAEEARRRRQLELEKLRQFWEKWLLEREAILTGIQEAFRALDLHPACLEMFGTNFNPYEKMLQYLSARLIRVSDQHPSFNSAGTLIMTPFANVNIGAITVVGTGSLPPTNPGGSRISAPTITINSRGPYFTNLAHGLPLFLTPAFRGLTLAEARGSMIIHEFLHVAGTRSDEGDEARSNAISMEVREKCV